MHRRHALVGNPRYAQAARDFQLRFLVQQGLLPCDRLLDYGCGTLRGGLPIIQYLDTGRYTGIDCRAQVLTEARSELTEQALEWKAPLLCHTSEIDLLNDEFALTYDVMLAFMVLMHVDDDDLDYVFELMSSVLDDTGTAYANINALPVEETQWREFPVLWHPVSWYDTRAARHGLTMAVIGTLAELGYEGGYGEQLMLEFRPCV